MIYESSKDYGTGEILMIHDGETTAQEVCDYLQRNHSQDVNEGDQLQFTDASEYHGYDQLACHDQLILLRTPMVMTQPR